MKWITKLVAWFKKLISNVQVKAKVVIPVVIEVVNNVKNFVDSPLADFITTVIPGNTDDAVVKSLRTILPKVLIEIRKWNTIANIDDENEKLKAIINEFNSLSKAERDGIKTELAAILVSETTGLSVADAKIATLISYHYPESLNS